MMDRHDFLKTTGTVIAGATLVPGSLAAGSPHRASANSVLNCPGLEATNWRGEQGVRPAVVARKVWGGNRTENGAHVQEVLTTVLRTGRQRAVDALPCLAALLRSPKPYVLDFDSHYPARC